MQSVLRYGSVVHDPNGRLFRMWYDSSAGTRVRWVTFLYAESDDGSAWRKPCLDLVPGRYRARLRRPALRHRRRRRGSGCILRSRCFEVV